MDLVTIERVYSNLAREYRRSSITPIDESEKIIAMLTRLLTIGTQSKPNVISLSEEAIRIISGQLELREGSVLLLDEKDNKYRYRAFYGLTKDVIKAHKEIEYTYDEVIEYERKNMRKVSNLTYLCFSENRPKEELKFFNLHFNKERKALDDYIEGDFFDTHIFDSRAQLLGYIEYTGTKKNKMPPAKTILTIELMASLIGLLLTNTRP